MNNMIILKSTEVNGVVICINLIDLKWAFFLLHSTHGQVCSPKLQAKFIVFCAADEVAVKQACFSSSVLN